MLPNQVKMVIWDLDDTFWAGTLTEDPITPIPTNIEIVKTLAQRGIISSIASKNNHDEARAELTSQNIWDYFVFPKIAFTPKGQNIADIIEQANLRPENILFIDDNNLNREHATHSCPGLMTADPSQILPTLLTLPQLQGKSDPTLTRLTQYKTLESKATDRQTTTGPIEDFLRTCAIRVEIDYQIENHIERIVELANRTNQLNFTKRRLHRPQAIAKFRAILTSYGITAGVVKVSDKYGDYGITGYFVLRRTAKKNRLIHFAFSCRTMNMGLEQYIYERLQSPEIKIVEPIANPITTFPHIDWITEGTPIAAATTAPSDKKLLLIGGCELLQLASMCSSNREEFVNTVRQGTSVRYDDPGFILADRGTLANSETLAKLNYWSHTEALKFDMTLDSSQLVIAALFNILTRKIYKSPEGIMIRLAEDTLQRWLRDDPEWFNTNFIPIKINLAGKFALIEQCLDRLTKATPRTATRFALGVNTKKLPVEKPLAEAGWPQNLKSGQLHNWLKALNNVGDGQRGAATRHVFNRYLQDYCHKYKTFRFVDVNALTNYDDIHDPDPETGKFLPDHLTRRGYIAIATHITTKIQAADPPATQAA